MKWEPNIIKADDITKHSVIKLLYVLFSDVIVTVSPRKTTWIWKTELKAKPENNRTGTQKQN